MKTKKKRTLVITIIAIVVGIFFLSILLKSQVISRYFSIVYDKEIILVKKYLSVLSEGQETRIREIATESSILLRPSAVEKIPKKIQKLDINTLITKAIDKDKEDGSPVLFLNIYFENDTSKYMIVKLKMPKEIWLIDSLTLGDGVAN